MKKIISLCLALTMIFALAACSNSQSADENSSESSSSVPATESAEQTEQSSSSDEEEPAETPSEQSETDAKTLVVYFSMPETTDPSSSEYPFFAIAASLACCNSSSKRFLATPDL